jgi:hypothetical protein
MNPAAADDTMERAGRLISHSRIAAVVAFLVSQSAASARSSRAIGFGRRRANAFQSLPAEERTRCALIAAAAALAGHAALAALLPASASPMLSLTTLALLGALVAAGVSTK